VSDNEAGMSSRTARANIRLPHSDRAPRLARAFVADRLAGWNLEALIEVAALVVSEVVTNAVVHARSDAELSLERTPTALRITVTDQGTGTPTPRQLTPGSDGGRGLMIVQKLSTSWGSEPTGAGNRVWAELPIESR
jgi:anti-sigma regulatory factor (Ser/Thr protein kinase)